MPFFRHPSCRTLRDIRIKSGFTIEELSRQTGLDPSWLNDFETGKRLIWPEARRRIGRFFGISLSRLFPEIKGGLEEETPFPRCQKLKQAREFANLTQTELGFRSRLAPCYISRFENGAANPWPAAIIRICRTLEMAPADLFDLSEETAQFCQEELGKPLEK